MTKEEKITELQAYITIFEQHAVASMTDQILETCARAAGALLHRPTATAQELREALGEPSGRIASAFLPGFSERE